jgi:hypothetical protein
MMTARRVPIHSAKRDSTLSPPVQIAIVLIILALPFVVGTLLIHGLHDHIITFHGTDEELFYYPTIMKT